MVRGDRARRRGSEVVSVVVRIAAILARSALEDIVVETCAKYGVDVADATMRVRLATLIAVSDPKTGDLAMAWWSLSRACHQHAYEIVPGYDEVVYLTSIVRGQLGLLEHQREERQTFRTSGHT